ncbi:PQQ-binding-like beta-propeller repeat protein [Brevibacillus sp. 179-C9.3 HS]|uniref:outer membrane protein assembly factor BamB family protein n=1 Tax=unclassified Brevibacillus TaxID=2684853 RepID=UPI00399FC8D5
MHTHNQNAERVTFRDLQTHFSGTWYKNQLVLRNSQKDWIRQEFGQHADYKKRPDIVAEKDLGDRLWSIPGQIASDLVIAGCWDNYIYSFDLHTFQEKWKFRTEGPVYSSPAVQADGSFVIGCEDHVLRRIDGNGRLLWSYRAGGLFHGTPTIDAKRNRVYAACYDQHMYAFCLDSGELVWKIYYEVESPEECIYSSPSLCDNGNIIFGVDVFLVCLNPDGKELWRHTRTDFIDTTAALDYATRICVSGSFDKHIFAVDMDTGLPLWSYETDEMVVSCPAIGMHGDVCIGSDDGYVYAFNLQDGSLCWKSYIGAKIKWTCITTLPDGSYLYTGYDGILRCLCHETGELLWDKTFPQGVHSAPLLTHNDILVVGSHFGQLYFLKWE